MFKGYKLVLLLTLFATLCLGIQPGLAQSTTPSDTYCRFGIAVTNNVADYDLSQLGVGAYLDWGSRRSSSVPNSIGYFHVLRVSDQAYAQTLASLPEQLSNFSGAVWIIGNEPDAEVTYQDHIRADVYAQRYYELATLIRAQDPSARIAFGTIIQPTPVRLYYLSLALTELGKKTSSPASLIDIISIHNFILNEQPLYQNGVLSSWGAGVPPGYAAGVWPDPFVITIGGDSDETYKTHSIDIFQQRVVAVRTWMNEHGLRDKPLWITEFGSLFPSVGTSYLTVSETTTADFMQQAFDYMLSATSTGLGYPQDANRLVQHFVWYSLNDVRTHFGGSLFDPANKQRTLVGERFINYEPPASANLPRQPSDLAVLPDSMRVYPVNRLNPDLVNYRIVVRATNLIASEYHTQAMLKFYDNGVLLGEQTANLPRCAGQTVFTFSLPAQPVGAQHTFRAEITLLGGNGPETSFENNTVTFPTLALPPIYQVIMPIIRRNQ